MKTTPLALSAAAALSLSLAACSSPEALPENPPYQPPTQDCSPAGVAASDRSALPTVCILTSAGELVVELDAGPGPTPATATVANFLAYVNAQYYASTVIHRAERSPLQVFQGGALLLDADYFVHERTPGLPPIALESDNGLSNVRGTIAMARAAAPDSAQAQFYVNVQDNTELDRRTLPTPFDGYAVFGRVISGMATVDAIGAAPTTAISAGYAEFPSPVVIVYWARQLK